MAKVTRLPKRPANPWRSLLRREARRTREREAAEYGEWLKTFNTRTHGTKAWREAFERGERQ